MKRLGLHTDKYITTHEKTRVRQVQVEECPTPKHALLINVYYTIKDHLILFTYERENITHPSQSVLMLSFVQNGINQWWAVIGVNVLR